MSILFSDDGREALIQVDPYAPIAILTWTIEPAPVGGFWLCSICQSRPAASNAGRLPLGCEHAHALGLNLPLSVALRLEATLPPNKARPRGRPAKSTAKAPPVSEAAPTRDLDKAATKWLSARGVKTGRRAFVEGASTLLPGHGAPLTVRREDPEVIKARLAAARARKRRPSTSPFDTHVNDAMGIEESRQAADS